MKIFVSVACLALVLLAALSVEARPKRSVVVAAPLVASHYLSSPVVASVPVVRSAVIHSNPTTVVKTEQVHSGGQSSYSYSTETKSAPVVHTVAAAAPVAAVSTVHHTVPAYSYGYYPAYSYYSPYSYVIGK